MWKKCVGQTICYLSESVTDYVTARLNSKPIYRMRSELTLVSYSLLVNQLAVKSTMVNTNQLGGGEHGHLPLIINESKLQTITGVATATTDKTVFSVLSLNMSSSM